MVREALATCDSKASDPPRSHKQTNDFGRVDGEGKHFMHFDLTPIRFTIFYIKPIHLLGLGLKQTNVPDC